MRFWDSSALLALLANQQGAAELRAFETDPSMMLWWGTGVECVSGLRRLRREGRISDDDLQELIQDLEGMLIPADEIEPSEAVRSTACRLLCTHILRAADALQLAAAVVWAGQPSSKHGFVCLDQKLRQAAADEGFRVLPEVLEY